MFSPRQGADQGEVADDHENKDYDEDYGRGHALIFSQGPQRDMKAVGGSIVAAGRGVASLALHERHTVSANRARGGIYGLTVRAPAPGDRETPNYARRGSVPAPKRAGSFGQESRAAQIAWLQRSVGNRALSARLEVPAPAAGNLLMRKGRLSTSLGNLEALWTSFSRHSDEVEETLFDDFAPLLADYTKAAGVTKNQAKSLLNPLLTYDPDKEKAVNVAAGLEAWLTSASEGAERYYGEMRSSLQLLGSGHATLDWQFGVSDMTHPDAFSPILKASLEGKRTKSTAPAAVDTLIREARAQQTQRNVAPGNIAFTRWLVAIEIDADNPWPYTLTDLKPRNVSPSEVPALVRNDPTGRLPQPPAARIAARNLRPQKGKTTLALPMGQAGKHELWVDWLKSGLGRQRVADI